MIPHFSELADKYRDKATLISVYGDGRHPAKDTASHAYMDRIERLVSRMGEALKFSVIADGPKQPIYSGWMDAAGENALTTTFIIDQQGTLTWIGPARYVDFPLARIVSGTFRPGMVGEKKDEGRNARVELFYMERNFNAAIQVVDSLINDDPTNTMLYSTKIALTLSVNQTEAYALARAFLKGPCRDSEPALYYIARDIMYDVNKEKPKDYDLVIAITERALIISKYEVGSARILEEQAKAYAAKGDYVKAIKADLRAIAFLDTYAHDDDEVSSVRASVMRTLNQHQSPSGK